MKMNTLQVPNHDFSRYETVINKIQALQTEGAKASIDQVNWEKDFPKSLPVSVRVAHDGNRLYLYYKVTGEALRAVNTEDFGSIWQDSCVEFSCNAKGDGLPQLRCNVLGHCCHETAKMGCRKWI